MIISQVSYRTNGPLVCLCVCAFMYIVNSHGHVGPLFLGKPPRGRLPYLVHISPKQTNALLNFLNQWKDGCRNVFMTKLHEKEIHKNQSMVL